MATVLRTDRFSASDPRRWVIGVEVSADCRRVSAALVSALGQGMDVQPEILGSTWSQTPRKLAVTYAQLTDGQSETKSAGAIEAIGTLAAQLADFEASVIQALLDDAGLAPTCVLAVGVIDPGWWSPGKSSPDSYLGLADAARLAERTGLNVIDAFAARDIAAGGQGGPLAPLAAWTLLRHPTFHRLLLDLGRTLRISYLPKVQRRRGSTPVLSFEVGPGMALLDLLAQRFSQGEQAFDPAGRFAVQGGRIDALLDHWLADPYFRRPLPRWHSRGVRPERFLLDAMKMAVDHGWSIRDLLCTATHFLADGVALAARRLLPEEATVDEILVAGGGQHNGMLLGELALRFPKTTMTRLTELGIDSEALAPACAAILALFHLDQVPASRPEITGAEVARVLGRLTPGSPQSWQHLLGVMGASRPAVRPLRSAL